MKSSVGTIKGDGCPQMLAASFRAEVFEEDTSPKPLYLHSQRWTRHLLCLHVQLFLNNQLFPAPASPLEVMAGIFTITVSWALPLQCPGARANFLGHVPATLSELSLPPSHGLIAPNMPQHLPSTAQAKTLAATLASSLDAPCVSCWLLV